ncbi:MAG: helix-turn-helix domain-containing protein [Clostridia bacterium]|nr:helix-turn-helix domain-containing protein [Oscillospiraceae bacterium]MBQ6701725.1 helix-turn-helix domain-containing protein [Clostridia bacterium]
MKAELLEKLTPITEEERRFLDGEKNIDRSIYMEGQGDTVNSKKLLMDGKLITVRPHTRFVHFPEHSHDYVEVIYMCRGSTTHIINGTKIVLKEGELLFLSPRAKQEILPAGENDIAVNFIIMPAFFQNTVQMIGTEQTPLHRFIIDVLTGTNSSSSYIHFEVSDVLPIQNLVENLIYTLIYGTSNKRNINQSTMGLLILNLINYTDRVAGENDDKIVLSVLRYIENNYRDGSLTELADRLHYDFTWLSREIKQRTGRTYTELLQDKRLAQAKFLLRNTGMKISDVANETGYDNISYFHRLFRGEFGMSPKKYRDSCK